MGDIDLAFKTIQKSINQNPKNSKAYYNQGRILQELVILKKH